MELDMKKILLVILASTNLIKPAVSWADLSHLTETAMQMLSKESIKKQIEVLLHQFDKLNDRDYSKKIIIFSGGSILTGAALALLIKKHLAPKPYNIFIITFEDGNKVIHHYESTTKNKPMDQLIANLIKENITILRRNNKSIFLEVKTSTEETDKIIKQIAKNSKDLFVLKS